MNNKVFLI